MSAPPPSNPGQPRAQGGQPSDRQAVGCPADELTQEPSGEDAAEARKKAVQPIKLGRECQGLVASWLRLQEMRMAAGNPQRLHELEQTSDDELLKTWLWKFSIIGGPVTFVIIPIILCIFQIFTWPALMTALWLVAKICMAIVFLVFLFTVYLTMSSKDG